jgi:hypothetical protein
VEHRRTGAEIPYEICGKWLTAGGRARYVGRNDSAGAPGATKDNNRQQQGEEMMKRLFAFGAIGAFAMLVASQAGAQSADELKCETSASKVVAKFIKSKGKCTQKCWSAERKGETVDCDPAGGRDATTQACIDAAEQKSLDGQAKKCTADCPECYSGGNCPSNAQTKTNTAEGLFDGQDPGLHCNNTGVSDDEAKCQASASKSLTKYVGALSKCSQKCKTNEAKGTTDGTCDPTPGPVGDTATQACISAADTKCVDGVNKKCADAGAVPICWPFSTGTQWCNLVKGIVNGQYDSFFCETGSASGAFLE